MPTAWTLAKSLDTLRTQLNSTYPFRSKASDGTIGDAAHALTPSEHNPDRNGVVRAIDITQDPAHGLDIQQLANSLVASRDSRILYLVANKRIISPASNWQWQAYGGADPHTNHIHLSVNDNHANTNLWKIGEQETMTPYALNLLSQIAWNAAVNGSDPFVTSYTGKDIERVLEDVLKSSANVVQRTKAANYDKQIASRDAQIAALQAKVVTAQPTQAAIVLAPGTYYVK